MEITVKILNEAGLHARPAGVLVKAAAKFAAEISLEFKGKKANAKSVIHVMTLSVKKGDEVKIVAQGADEKEALEAMALLIAAKCGIE